MKLLKEKYNNKLTNLELDCTSVYNLWLGERYLQFLQPRTCCQQRPFFFSLTISSIILPQYWPFSCSAIHIFHMFVILYLSRSLISFLVSFVFRYSLQISRWPEHFGRRNMQLTGSDEALSVMVNVLKCLPSAEVLVILWKSSLVSLTVTFFSSSEGLFLFLALRGQTCCEPWKLCPFLKEPVLINLYVLAILRIETENNLPLAAFILGMAKHFCNKTEQWYMSSWTRSWVM